ncbi:unnamed protein product [Larinioides sclopetarius]|uniref:Uncharacterized protein n=1 Tax=Larinioides sclopetarius TaxID=280406 RepID=A0AAV2B0L0_9ARAC
MCVTYVTNHFLVYILLKLTALIIQVISHTNAKLVAKNLRCYPNLGNIA